MRFPNRPRRRGRRRRLARAAAVTLAAVAVVALGGTAVAEPPDPAGDPAPATFARTPLWVYGHSFTTNPGALNTRGAEWMPELARQLGMPAWSTFGVGASRLIDTYGDLARQAVRAPVANSAWSAARRGVVVLQSEFNDAMNPSPTRAPRAVPLTTLAAANYGQTLQASLAVLASSSRADWSSAATSRGWATTAAPHFLGGSLPYTTTYGASRDLTVDVGASGTAWVVTWDVARTARTPGTGTALILVDGRQRAVVPARAGGWEPIYSARRGGYLHTAGPRATRISGLAPGRHVIRVMKSDRGPGAVYLDQLLVQAERPAPVVVVKDPPPLTAGIWPTWGSNRPTVLLNRRLLHAQIDAVAAQFANVTTASLAAPRPEHFGRDGVHFSDLGMEYEAGVLADALRRQVETYDVPAMYQ